jgi:murein DD-endopeptidase MepM/ murein hydrolase activator NlpD
VRGAVAFVAAAAVAGTVVFATPMCAAAGKGTSPVKGTPPEQLRVRPGDVFVLRPPPGQGAPESAVFLGKRYAPLVIAGEPAPVFLLGADMDAPPGSQTVVVARTGGGEQRIPLQIVKRAFPEEKLNLPPAMVTPPKELEERIVREQAEAAAIYRGSGGAALWERGFTRPLAQKAAGNFGRRRVLNGIAKNPHGGQDYTAPAGTPVRAIAAGRVRIARDYYYSGLTLLVDHGAGLVSQYLHLEKLLVAEGEAVGAGQVIGRVGATGRATGPHLHLGARLFEQRVDPESLWGLFPAPGP